MPKYLCLQRSLPGGDSSAEKPSPAQMQGMYEKFNAWREKFQENLVDLGGRLGTGRLALPDPAPDGPLVEVKELVGGYMIVSASDLNEAIEIARQCPGFQQLPRRARRRSSATRKPSGEPRSRAGGRRPGQPATYALRLL